MKLSNTVRKIIVETLEIRRSILQKTYCYMHGKQMSQITLVLLR